LGGEEEEGEKKKGGGEEGRGEGGENNKINDGGEKKKKSQQNDLRLSVKADALVTEPMRMQETGCGWCLLPGQQSPSPYLLARTLVATAHSSPMAEMTVTMNSSPASNLDSISLPTSFSGTRRSSLMSPLSLIKDM